MTDTQSTVTNAKTNPVDTAIIEQLELLRNKSKEVADVHELCELTSAICRLIDVFYK